MKYKITYEQIKSFATARKLSDYLYARLEDELDVARIQEIPETTK